MDIFVDLRGTMFRKVSILLYILTLLVYLLTAYTGCHSNFSDTKSLKPFPNPNGITLKITLSKLINDYRIDPEDLYKRLELSKKEFPVHMSLNDIKEKLQKENKPFRLDDVKEIIFSLIH